MILDDLVKSTGDFKNVMKFFPEYRFEYIYGDQYYGFSAETLGGLNQAVQEIPGARQWIIEDGNIYSAHPVMRAITNHPLVESFGHTGGTMSWTMCVLKEAYMLGWDNFIKRVLPLRGIGKSYL
jgi:hypothetical protein